MSLSVALLFSADSTPDDNRREETGAAAGVAGVSSSCTTTKVFLVNASRITMQYVLRQFILLLVLY